MQILRPMGKSTTKFTNDDRLVRLRRFLADSYREFQTAQSRDASNLHGGDFTSAIPIDADRAVIRQIVSLFNKIVRTSPRLRDFDLQTYIDRVRLSQALSDLIPIQNPERAEEYKELWDALLHPYAAHPIDFRKPKDDGNAAIIERFGQKERGRDHFRGRWHDVFWRVNENGKPDYRGISEAILEHLFNNEKKISGKDRRRATSKGPDVGLIRSRALAIFRSTHDPRQQGGCINEETQAQAVGYYFYNDIANAIFNAVGKSTSKSDRTSSAEIGRMLFDHFGSNPHKAQYADFSDPLKKAIWGLHNKVRQFYQATSQSERFRRLFGSDSIDWNQLPAVIPKDKETLLALLGVKGRNRRLLRLIRLGKAIAHALDRSSHEPTSTVAGGTFQTNLEFMLTSEGQADIKRNEAFARAWRTSIGLSCRTIGVWTDKASVTSNKELVGEDQEVDVAASMYAVERVRNLKRDTFLAAGRSIFGDKKVLGGDRSRLATVTSLDGVPWSEVLWGFLRLNGEMRNAASHFNTRKRFVDVIRGGIVENLGQGSKTAPDNRKGNEVADGAIRCFEELLKFDRALARETLLVEVERLKIRQIAPLPKLAALFEGITIESEDTELVTPKFMTVLSRANRLARSEAADVPADIRQFGRLDLAGLSSRADDHDVIRVGILRLLYSRGFEAWLREQVGNAELLIEMVDRVVESRRNRRAAYEKEHGRHYVCETQMLEGIDLSSITSLDDLMRRLTVAAMSDETMARRSRAAGRSRFEKKALAAEQRNRAGEVELFRQDLFGSLFGRYLGVCGFSWLLDDFSDLAPGEGPEAEIPEQVRNVEPWHAPFYAWLYLLPPDDVALLRHQFRKTAALEALAEEAIDDDDLAILKDIDRLMGLYVSVQAAGFGGLEHAPWFELDRKTGTRESAFYEDAKQFDDVFSAGNETHHMSIAGTRRGLRQVLRFQDQLGLRTIFEKHRVTPVEVTTFVERDNDKRKSRKALFDEKIKLRKRIDELSGVKEMSTVLRQDCARYRQLAGELARYDFEINAARLTEFSKLYRLTMRVIGRLNDFTLMWERDRLYMMLGMLYEKLGPSGFKVEVRHGRVGSEDRTWIGVNLRDEPGPSIIEAPLSKKQGALSPILIEQYGFFPIWDNRLGALPKGYAAEVALLTEDDQQVFSRFFDGSSAENPKDVAARAKMPAAQLPGSQTPYSWQRSKRQIRNDFAHYNVIGGRVKILKLTYRVNAVRSLFGYDRKMKNVVSKAIADIVRDEGLDIRWKMRGDRLRDVEILPLVRTELGFLGRVDGDDLSFDLPQVSVRYTSMVQALFGFDPGGHREVVTRDGLPKARGRLRYPSAFLARYRDRMPEEVLSEYPDLPQK